MSIPHILHKYPKLETQKRIAKCIWRIGKKHVWLDPTKAEIIAKAKCESDVNVLIEKGYIKKKKSAPNPAVNRFNWQPYWRIQFWKKNPHLRPKKNDPAFPNKPSTWFLLHGR